MNILDIAVSSIPFLSLREKILLRKNIDSLDKLSILSKVELSSIIQRDVRKAFWDGNHFRALTEKASLIMGAKDIKSVVFGSAEYPYLLSQIPDAPYVLYYRGNLEVLERQCISVVGTRNLDEEGAESALEFSRNAASFGNTIVSGLAFGTDSFAHRGAVEAKGATCAVLPCGIDTVVPLSNRGLAQRILSNNGLVCGEYLPGTPCEGWRFVQRNRIIAALSCATVVIQAGKGSGSLLTADFALDYDRDLFFHRSCLEYEKKCRVQPKNINKRSPSSYIEEGAQIIDSYADFVDLENNPYGLSRNSSGQLNLSF